MGVILVTGASRGIGRGIAISLAGAGHTVAVHYNGNREAAESCVKACSEATTAVQNHHAFQANIAEATQRSRLVEQVLTHYGEIHGLVNNAGIAPRRRDDVLEASEEVYQEVMAVNLTGPYFLTQLVARHWASNPGKGDRRIAFVTSVSAEMPSVNRGEYCVSKAGLSMAVQLFAVRLAEIGIPVIEVRPGITKTDMTAGVSEKYDRLIADGLVPQRRWGMPEDTGKVICSFMDGHLDFSTGTVINTDGGLTIPEL
jgi:3-oxoacyl-[acyl-carrier protein] reductase